LVDVRLVEAERTRLEGLDASLARERLRELESFSQAVSSSPRRLQHTCLRASWSFWRDLMAVALVVVMMIP